MQNKLLLCFLLFSLLSSAAAQTNWQLLNPEPSFQPGLAIKFISNNTGFIVNTRELLQTKNGGQNWYKNRDIPGGNDIAFKDALGFIAGNFGYVLKSTDYGEHWQNVSVGAAQSFNTVTIINADTILISGQSQLSKSFDGGNSWISLPMPDFGVKKSFFINGQLGHVVCNSGKIYKTVDGGNQWYNTLTLSTFPSNFAEIYFLNEQIGFASREHSAIHKTIDGGESWEEIPNTSDLIFDFQFLDENTGFICGENGTIFKTTDGGNTWNWISFQPTRIAQTTIFGLYFLDEYTGFATGARGRIVKTVDGGQSWSGYAPTYEDILHLDFPTNTTGYAQARERFYKTTDAGANWAFVGAPNYNGYGFPNGFDFIDENTGFAISGGTYSPSGQIFKTSDGGQHWNELSGVSQYFTSGYKSLEFITEDIGFVSKYGNGNEYNTTYKTVDGGVSWSEVVALSFDQMQFLDLQTGFALNKGMNRIYKTSDGGLHWGFVFEKSEGINAFHFLNENSGFAVGNEGVVYKTNDGGISWQKVTVPYGDYTLVHMYSQQVVYIADDYGKLYETSDGGANWQFSLEAYQLSDIVSKEDVYLGGTEGKIFKKDLGALASQEPHSSPSRYLIYPNPASNKLTLTDVSKEPILTVALLDLYGRNVFQTPNPDLSNTMTIKLPDLPKGVYLMEITGKNTRNTSKITLQ